jgi:glycosidase
VGRRSVNYRAPYERVAVAFAVLYTSRGAPLLYYGDEVGLPGCNDPDNRRVMQWSGYSTDQQWLHERLKKLGKIREAHPACAAAAQHNQRQHDTWVYSMTGEGRPSTWPSTAATRAPPSAACLPATIEELIESR